MINPEKITATEAENEKLKTEISRLEQENSELRTLNNWYVEQFKLAQHLRFGASSEKQVLPGQMKLFNEAEVIADSSPPEPVLEETVIRKRKKRSGKRDELYYGLPTEQRVHELPVEDRICPICGGNLHACGHETLRRELEVVPASIKAVEHIQTVYSCRACEQSEDSELAVPMIKSEVPKPVIAGSGIASPSLLAFVLSNKYVLALPLSRQEQEFRRQNIVISRQNMANWCIYVAMHWLMPIYTLLKNVFLAFTNNHADETVLQVINEPGRKATTNSYFWVYLTGFYAEHQVVLFEYTETRAGKHPLKFLEGYTGTLNVDAYQGYYALEDKGVTLVGCWTHVRRKFVDVLKTMPKHQHENHPATKGLAYCDQLFALERKFDEHNLTPAERHERRQIESKPVTTALFAWANNLLLALPGKSKLREAVVYVVNQQHRLSNFLLDGHIEISNNRAERSIIPFAVGRNNWMFAYSPKGAAASAIIYSIAETAKANGLVPFKYFEFLFETLPNIPKEQFSDCLPWNSSVTERCKAPT